MQRTERRQDKGAEAASQPAGVPRPQSIHDISNGNILGFGADLAEDHPGYHDAEYKRRRQRISEAAKQHRMCAHRHLQHVRDRYQTHSAARS